MTRERAFELAEIAIQRIRIRHSPAPASHIANAILAATAQEREACAKIADGQREQTGNTPDWYCACGCIADEIRERGK